MLTIDIEATFKLIGLVLFFGYFIGFWITIHIPQEDKNRPVVFDPKKVEENIINELRLTPEELQKEADEKKRIRQLLEDLKKHKIPD